MGKEFDVLEKGFSASKEITPSLKVKSEAKEIKDLKFDLEPVDFGTYGESAIWCAKVQCAKINCVVQPTTGD